MIEVREYLDGLRLVDDDTVADDEFGAYTKATPLAISDVDLSVAPVGGTTGDTATRPTAAEGDGRDFERWLFADWLNKATNGKGGRRKEPALPILKDAKWNSGDNPVLVTAAM